MISEIFDDYNKAIEFAHSYLVRGKMVGLKKAKNTRKWIVRVLATK